MKKILVWIVALVVVAAVILGVLWFMQDEELIRVDAPVSGELVTSPLLISGQARGYWYFEGSFPVRLIDENGSLIAQGVIVAADEWMTEEMVPFEGVLEFNAPSTSQGTLVLMKDNPSGLPEHDAAVEIPVRF